MVFNIEQSIFIKWMNGWINEINGFIFAEYKTFIYNTSGVVFPEWALQLSCFEFGMHFALELMLLNGT